MKNLYINAFNVIICVMILTLCLSVYSFYTEPRPLNLIVLMFASVFAFFIPALFWEMGKSSHPKS